MPKTHNVICVVSSGNFEYGFILLRFAMQSLVLKYVANANCFLVLIEVTIVGEVALSDQRTSK